MAEGPAKRAHRRVGTVIREKYRIDAFLATGSMANVYAATHRNGSRVALKILHRELARDESMAERFRREGYFANSIGHAGVIRAIDDDVTEDGCAFLVMELLDGENLEERRQRLGGRVPLGEALRIADAMLEILGAAHDHEILHRDLKPENIFITKQNEVKLLDFGVARFNDGRSSSDMTAAGMVLGSPAFMPPEQALGLRDEVDARSDIWGVGALLFTTLAGEWVHAGGDAKAKLIATARQPARPLRDVAPHVPRAVASVVDRALAFEKIERWADARAMREALRWARMSLDEAELTGERVTLDAEPSTRRAFEDEPTLARRSPIHEDLAETAQNTTRRERLEPLSEDVFTSAPPITQRDIPSSMQTSEGPSFALRRTRDEEAPETERVPKKSTNPPPAAGRPPDPSNAPSSPSAPPTPSVDLPMSFTRPMMAMPAPVTAAVAAIRPNVSTAPGIGPIALPTDAALPQFPRPAPTISTAPPPVISPSAPPPVLATPSTLPAVRPTPPTSSRTSLPPGPLLATIVPKKNAGRAVRIALPLAIGLIASVTTYAAVTKRRAALADLSQHTPATSASVVVPAESITIPSATVAPASASPPPPPPQPSTPPPAEPVTEPPPETAPQPSSTVATAKPKRHVPRRSPRTTAGPPPVPTTSTAEPSGTTEPPKPEPAKPEPARPSDPLTDDESALPKKSETPDP